jgi:uncharacterized protein (DUF1697 family)
MTAHIALLRSVNVGKRKVLKDDLLGLAKDLEFGEAKTLLASGNLVLWGDHAGGAALEAALEAALQERIGLSTDFMVRSPAELKAIIDGNPYPGAAQDHPSHLIVNFLKAAIPEADVSILRAAITGPETFEARERELYIDFPISIADSLLDRDWKKTKRNPVGTTRNWNTVLKLADMVGQ